MGQRHWATSRGQCVLRVHGNTLSAQIESKTRGYLEVLLLPGTAVSVACCIIYGAAVSY
jgi:hypothetical protein